MNISKYVRFKAFQVKFLSNLFQKTPCIKIWVDTNTGPKGVSALYSFGCFKYLSVTEPRGKKDQYYFFNPAFCLYFCSMLQLYPT